MFLVGDTVLYRLKKDTLWKAATVLTRIGSCLYRLNDTETSKEIRVHANQMKIRYARVPSKESFRFLRSDYDYDSENYLNEPPSSCTSSSEMDSSSDATSSSKESSPDSTPPVSPVPVRLRRTRVPVKRLNVNPKKKSYA